MLQSLSIKNYAIIDAMDISFSPHHTVITGETGAGKSILLGALGLLLGDRADSKVLFQQDSKCIIEGCFDIRTRQMGDFFEAHELDDDGNVCIIRREISAQGKSRAFINDSPVNLKVLRELALRLIDIHEQFDSHELDKTEFMTGVLDSLAENHIDKEQYTTTFAKWKLNTRQYARLSEMLESRLKERDYNDFLLNELDELAPAEGEDEVLEQKVRLLRRSDALKQTCSRVMESLDGGEYSVRAAIQSVIGDLRQFSGVSDSLDSLISRLNSQLIEIDDVIQEMDQFADGLDTDPESLAITEERLNNVNRLLTKHRVTTTAELLSLANGLRKTNTGIARLEEELNDLNAQIVENRLQLTELAHKMSSQRKNVIPVLQQHVIEMLADLGMPHVRFEVDITDAGTLLPNGSDQVAFLFSANPGMPMHPIGRIASGGERSRLMFAIKSMVARSSDLPTMVFDEIDSGISGAISLRMAHWLRKLSRNHQVICITHSPQIASAADLHLRIAKTVTAGKTRTGMETLDSSARITELAKMLSGDPPSEGAIRNAGELLQMNTI